MTSSIETSSVNDWEQYRNDLRTVTDQAIQDGVVQPAIDGLQPYSTSEPQVEKQRDSLTVTVPVTPHGQLELVITNGLPMVSAKLIGRKNSGTAVYDTDNDEAFAEELGRIEHPDTIPEQARELLKQGGPMAISALALSFDRSAQRRLINTLHRDVTNAKDNEANALRQPADDLVRRTTANELIRPYQDPYHLAFVAQALEAVRDRLEDSDLSDIALQLSVEFDDDELFEWLQSQPGRYGYDPEARGRELSVMQSLMQGCDESLTGVEQIQKGAQNEADTVAQRTLTHLRQQGRSALAWYQCNDASQPDDNRVE